MKYIFSEMTFLKRLISFLRYFKAIQVNLIKLYLEKKFLVNKFENIIGSFDALIPYNSQTFPKASEGDRFKYFWIEFCASGFRIL